MCGIVFMICYRETLTWLKIIGIRIASEGQGIMPFLVVQTPLFYFPERHGGVGNLLMEVPEREMYYAYEEIVQVYQYNEYQEYFEYAKEALGLPRVPVRDTQEACELYQRLMRKVEEGI